MLEYLVIFRRGGAILWTFGQLLNVKGNPVNTLIRNCLLADRGGDGSFTYRPPVGTDYTLKWKFHNGLDLVVVAVYQHMLSLPWVDTLLTSLRDEFAAVYKPDIYKYDHFDDTYKRLLARAQQPTAQDSRQRNGRASQAKDGSDTTIATPDCNPSHNGVSTPETSQRAFNVQALSKKIKVKQASGKSPSSSKTSTLKKGKKPRNWNETNPDVDNLDFSKDSGGAASSLPTADPAMPSADRSRMDTAETVSYDDDDKALEEQLAARGNGTRQNCSSAQTSVLGSLVSSLQTSIMGKEALSAADVKAAVDVMQKRLQQRNVSSEVAGKVCSYVAATLEGKKLASFTRVAAMVRSAMEQSITRILSPPRSTDILAEVKASQAKGKPYSIVFVGVNGVGKSTSLAKVAYWLRQQDLRVMIAACDTFRSGAVEQLKTHCNRLGVPLYDRGYDRDPTNVAAEAMRQAQRDGIDVVLVDTAGRMQDNEPLMQALSMLINKNSPDLVLFVGEALVGNDGVNQLVKFNQRLADLSPTGKSGRLIDGVLVTKFDAIDDKVGAVLSMAYSSGAPIMFVGCGQTYVDLMRLDVRSVVRSLLR